MSTNHASQEYLRIWDNPDRQWSYEVGGHISEDDIMFTGFIAEQMIYFVNERHDGFSCMIHQFKELTFIWVPEEEDFFFLDNGGTVWPDHERYMIYA